MIEALRGLGAHIHDAHAGGGGEPGTVIDRLVDGDLTGAIDWVAIQVGPLTVEDTAPERNLAGLPQIRDRLAARGVRTFAWFTGHGQPVESDASYVRMLCQRGYDVWLNLEDGYEGENQWKTKTLFDLVGRQQRAPGQQSSVGPATKKPGDPTPGCVVALSYPTTPAERYAIDWRCADQGGLVFAPQSYYCQFPQPFARVKPLTWSTYTPNTVWVGWWYRVNFRYGNVSPGIRWCKATGVETVEGDRYLSLKDGINTWGVKVTERDGGTFVGTGEARLVYQRRTKQKVGTFLGFTALSNITPTIGTYNGWEGADPARVGELVTQLRELKTAYPGLDSANLYLLENTRGQLVQALRRELLG